MDLIAQEEKQELLKLIKKLPAKDLRAAKMYLKYLIAVSGYETKSYVSFDEFLASLQNEDITAAEQKRINRLKSKGIKEINEGKTIALKQAKELYGA